MTISKSAKAIMSFRVSSKRTPAMVGSQRSEPQAYLSEIPCTAYLPVSPEIAQRMPTRNPYELLQVFIPGDYDVREGDVLYNMIDGDGTIIDSREYPVRDAAEWALRDRKLIHLVVEDLKT